MNTLYWAGINGIMSIVNLSLYFASQHWISLVAAVVSGCAAGLLFGVWMERGE